MSSRGGWDRERVSYDRDYERDQADRGRDRFDRVVEDDRYTMRGGRGREHSDERHDRRPYDRSYGDDFRQERRFHDDDPRLAPRRDPMPEQDYSRRVVIDRERDREYYRSPSPRRPGFLRRQSSLDTFDRRPLRNFTEREEYPPPARREDIYREDFRAPPYKDIPLPAQEPLPPSRRPRQRFYEDVEVPDPDRFGAERYPERVREREIVRTRRERDDSRETRTTRTRSHRGSSRSSSTSSSSSTSRATTVKNEYPKKGKTRIPAKLVSKRAIIDIGYPFIEEGNTIVVLKALGQDNIDDLLKRSDEYKKAELEVADARSSAAGLHEERREEIFVPPGPSYHPAPPAPVPVVVAAPPAPAPVIIDAVPLRGSSPTTTSTSSYESSYHPHRHHDHYDYHHEHSGPMGVGPVALVERSRSRSRNRKDIRAEIKALQKELVHRPKYDKYDDGNREIVRAERLPDGQLVVYEEERERLESGPKPPRIEKDKKGPPPKLVRAMLATLT